MSFNWLQPLRPFVQELGAAFDESQISIPLEYVRTFDTVADMQAATDLTAGMTCHTNGFHSAGDGGAAYYAISASGTANGMDVLVCGELFASLVVTEPYATPEQFGAYGDGTHDDTDFVIAALANKKLMGVTGKSYLITDTIQLSQYTEIYNCNFKGNRSIDLFDVSSHCLLKKCYFSSFNKVIKNSISLVATTFDNCVFASSSYGAYLDCAATNSLNETRFTNCYFVLCDYGIYLKNNFNSCVITGCVFEVCTYYGIYLGLDSSSFAPSAFIHDNYFEQNKEAAIYYALKYYVPIRVNVSIRNNFYSTANVPNVKSYGIYFVDGSSISDIEDLYGTITMSSDNGEGGAVLSTVNQDHSFTFTESEGTSTYRLIPSKFASYYKMVIIATLNSNVDISLSGVPYTITNGVNEFIAKRFSNINLSRTLANDEEVTILKAYALR